MSNAPFLKKQSWGINSHGIMLLVVLLIALGIRASALDNVLYHGEADNTNFDGYMNSKVSHAMLASGEPWMKAYLHETGYIPEIAHHGPLSVAMYFVGTVLFGQTTSAYRLVTLIVSLFLLWYIFRFVRMLYDGRTARIANIVTAVAALSFWVTLASVSVDQHNAITMLTFTAACFHYLRHERTGMKKDFYLSALFTGLAALTSFFVVILASAISLYILIKRSSINAKIARGISYFWLPALMFGLFPLLAALTNWSIMERTLSNAGNVSTISINYSMPVYFAIWGTALIPGLFVLSLFLINRKNWRAELLLYLLVAVGIAYNLLGKIGIAALDRYLMPIVPVMIILSAKVFTKWRPTRKHIAWGGTAFIIGMLGMVLLNTGNAYEPHDLAAYGQKALRLDWNFYFPVTGPSGPVFGVAFSSIMIPLITGSVLILICIYALRTKKRSKKENMKESIYAAALSVFLGILLAQNVFMGVEMAQPVMHPDVSAASSAALTGIRESRLSEGMLFTNTLAAWHYLGKNYSEFIYTGYYSPQEMQELIKQGGTALHIDYTKRQPDDPYWNIFRAQCHEVGRYSSRGQDIAFVYKC